jgi:D-ribose pyranose/furanose isomerase RbsD
LTFNYFLYLIIFVGSGARNTVIVCTRVEKIAITDEIKSKSEQVEEAITKSQQSKSKQDIDLNYISQQSKLLNIVK